MREIKTKKDSPLKRAFLPLFNVNNTTLGVIAVNILFSD